MEKRHIKILVKTPASTANIGAGYDCIAIAIDLWNFYEMHIDLSPFNNRLKEFDIRFLENQYYDIDPRMRTPDGNLFVRAFEHSRKAIFHKSNIRDYKRNIIVMQNNQIPPIRGLGSSSSASVAGVIAGIEYAKNIYPDIDLKRLGIESNKNILEMAREVDSCPDNICASLEGGLTTVFLGDADNDGTQPIYHFTEKIEDENIRLVFLVPSKPIPTTKARSLLERQCYPLKDCVFNITRAVCIPSIFREKRYSLLREALRDRVHQRQRASLYGDGSKTIDVEMVFKELLDLGDAYGACISGAGSTLLAITNSECAEVVASDFRIIFEKYAKGSDWEVEEVSIYRPSNIGAVSKIEYSF